MNDKPGGAPNQSGGLGANSGNFGARPAPNASHVKSLDEASSEGFIGGNSGGVGVSSGVGKVGGSGVDGGVSGYAAGMSVSSFAETLRQENAARNQSLGVNSGTEGDHQRSGGNVAGATFAGSDYQGSSGNVGIGGQGVDGGFGSNEQGSGGNVAGATFAENGGSGGNSATPPRAIEPEGLNRPMTKAAQAAPVVQKKPKKGLIIGLSCGIGALVLLIILGVAVAISVLNKPDPVADAMDKLMANGLPPYIHAEVSATAQLKDLTQLVSHYKVTGTADVMTSNMTNAADATVIIGGSDLDDTTFTVNEIYAGEKDLYFRFDGLFNAMDRIDAADLFVNGVEEEEELLCEDEDGEEVVCSEELLEKKANAEEEDDEEDGATSGTTGTESKTSKNKSQTSNKLKIKNPFSPEMMQNMLVLSEVIDGEWVKIPPEESKETTTANEVAEEETTEEEAEEGLVIADYTDYLTQAIEDIGGRATVCSFDLFATLRNNASAVAAFYRNHPFVKGTSENVTLASARYPVYQIVIEPENYGAFVDELQEQGLLNKYLKCAGETITGLKNYPALLPPIYVEIDSEGNFSRVYLSANTGTAEVVLDLALSYPGTINVQKPQSYMTLEAVEEEMATVEAEQIEE